MTTAAQHRAEAKRAARRRSRLLYTAIAGGVVLFAVLIAVLSSGERGDTVTVADVAGEPSISGEPLPNAPDDPAADPAVGSAAPRVEGADFTGVPRSIAADGPELVMFMASWCPACQQELPEVVTWMEQGGLPDEVTLTAVATGLDAARPNWPPDAWFEAEGYRGEVVVDDAAGSIARSFGLTATPFWVALDAEGRVVARIAGLLDAPQLTALAEAALGS